MCPVFKPSFRVHEAELVGERNGTRGVLVLKHGNEMDTSTNHRVTGIGTKATWAVSASENKRLLWRAAHFGFIPTLNGAIVIAYILPASFRQIMLASGELTTMVCRGRQAKVAECSGDGLAAHFLRRWIK